MKDMKSAIVGIGAIGSVLATTLLGKFPETYLIGRRPEPGDDLMKKKIIIYKNSNSNSSFSAGQLCERDEVSLFPPIAGG